MPQQSKRDAGTKDDPPDEVDDPEPRSAPVDTAGAVKLIRKPPGGLLAIPTAYALGLAMNVAAQSQAAVGLLPPDVVALSQPFLMAPGILVIASAWVLACRFFHRGRIWALGARARLHDAYKENARDESSCCEKDIERFRQRRHDIAEGNEKYTHLREEFRTSLKFIWLAPFAAMSMFTIIAFYGLGVDPASQWGLGMLSLATVLPIMLPVFKLARQLSSSETAGLSGSEKKKIDDENNCRRRDAEKSKIHTQFYDDAVNAVRRKIREFASKGLGTAGQEPDNG